jgi:hypothetical protein
MSSSRSRLDAEEGRRGWQGGLEEMGLIVYVAVTLEKIAEEDGPHFGEEISDTGSFHSISGESKIR